MSPASRPITALHLLCLVLAGLVGALLAASRGADGPVIGLVAIGAALLAAVVGVVVTGVARGTGAGHPRGSAWSASSSDDDDRRLRAGDPFAAAHLAAATGSTCPDGSPAGVSGGACTSSYGSDSSCSSDSTSSYGSDSSSSCGSDSSSF